ncbi:MAG: AI-2E family transporter [endosymbiont of Galathealinum brachiosum]|uniref:AI-2E family transporter n=1 Tax=endosymbiont of Galathealinum brachiosum TaxID=2200906 RepID=A0A370DBE0_9GAMM|nr:MAG: AI-2E family transporter [endosymbiont of Galathealinum brachiosum]
MSESQKWMMLLIVSLTGFVFYLLSPVLMPFFAAALLAYLGDPIADRLEMKFQPRFSSKLSRSLAVTIVFITLFSLLTIMAFLILPLLGKQIAYLVSNMPEYLDHIQNNVLPQVAKYLAIDTSVFDFDLLKKLFAAHYAQAGGIISQVVSSVASSGLALTVWAANMVLIPVVTFYLLRDWDVLMTHIDDLVPRKNQSIIRKLARESDEVLSAFLRGQFIVMLALGAVYSTGLWFIDLKLALLIGMLAGLVSFVPYLGFIVGIIAASVAMLLQTHDLMQLIPVIIVFSIGQMLEGMLLTPVLVGDKIGLHPVAVIFAILAGGQLFGFVGILLALPVAAVLAVMIRHMHNEYKSSSIFNDAT